MVNVKDLYDAMREAFQSLPELASYQWKSTKVNQINRVILDISSSVSKYIVVMSEIDEAGGFEFDESQIVKECFGGVPYSTKDLTVSCYNVDKDVIVRQPKYSLEYFIKAKSPFITKGFFHDVLFIGRKNAFLGLLFYNGSIIFYRPALMKLLNASKESFNNTLKIVATKGEIVSSNLYLNGIKGPSEFINDVVGSVIFSKYKSDIINTVKKSRDKSDYDAKIGNLISKIRSETYSIISPLFNGCLFGANSTYSYASLLKKMQKTYHNRMQEASLRAYEEGAIKSSVYASHGFRPNVVNGKLFWQKDMSLVPATCMLHGVLYTMPQQDKRGTPLSRVYHIDQLIVNPDGTLNAVGRHPNVGDGGRVCMGDMKDDAYRVATMGSDELDNFLTRAERLLDVINFDSAYIPYDRDFNSDQFVGTTMTPTRYAQRKSSSIRRAVFSDDVIEEISDNGIEVSDDEVDDQQPEVSQEVCDNMIRQSWTTIQPPNVETVPV